MRILWIPQVSSRSADGKILLNKDSNIAFIRNLICSDFCRKNEIIIAFEFCESDCVIDDEIKSNFVCLFNNSRSFSNAYIERFCFDSAFFESIKRNYNFDAIFINEPTKVIQLKRIFGCKIFTYVHWLAFKNMKEIELRQIEGINAADICFVNSQYTIDELERHYKYRYGIEVGKNIIVAYPPFAGSVKPIKKDAEIGFVYNHRLSSDRYYMRAFEILVDIFDKVENAVGYAMPKVYLTNPSGKSFSVKRKYFEVVDLPTQKDYNDFLSSGKVFCHVNTFFESEGMWSLSTVDCAVNGNICLLPDKYGYAEIFDRSYEGYCGSAESMLEKIIRLIYYKPYIDKFKQDEISRYSAENIGKKLNDDINNFIEE